MKPLAKLSIKAAAPEDTNASKTVFGFWLYLMTDCVLFATLFATFAVLRNNTNGGPSGAEIFSMPYVLVETLALLTSSLTSGLALISARKQQARHVMYWLAVTAALGLLFLGMELHEFRNLALENHSWNSSAFLSAFFTLVGTHGLHIATGLLWLTVFLWQLSQRGLTAISQRRLQLFTMFWHFLDLIWIFIFTIVYLFGAIS